MIFNIMMRLIMIATIKIKRMITTIVKITITMK